MKEVGKKQDDTIIVSSLLIGPKAQVFSVKGLDILRNSVFTKFRSNE